MADYDLTRWPDVIRLDQGTGALYTVSFIPSPSRHPSAGGNVLLFQIKYRFMLPPDVDPPNIAPNYCSTSCWDLRVPGFHLSLLVEDLGRWLSRAGVLSDARNDIVHMIFGHAWTSEAIRAIAVQIETSCVRPYIEYEEEEEELVRAQAERSMRECTLALKAASLEAVEALEKVAFSDAEREMSCAVCLEELSLESELTKMPCSHVFHGDCIVKWLEYQCVCPLCRFELPSSTVMLG